MLLLNVCADILVTAHEPRRPLLKEINAMALYPTEQLLWDETQLPMSDYTTDTVLALPKLNLQVPHADPGMRYYVATAIWYSMLCCAVLCYAVRCRCCAVQCCAVLCCAVPCRAVRCCAVLCPAVRCRAVLCPAVRCRAVLCPAVRCCFAVVWCGVVCGVVCGVWCGVVSGML